ncbi:MAG TPA: glycosyltransferase [Chloroflexi bacterium]|nr:glycosyltransferase [Chloroflexota bacterium]
MRIIFVYKFLTIGGVEVVLRTRLEALGQWGIHADAWFLSYIDGAKILDPKDANVFIGDVASLGDHLTSHDYDVLISIDTEEIFPLARRLEGRLHFILESHSPYRENLAYLQEIADLPLCAIFVPSAHQRSVVRKIIGSDELITVVPNPLSESFMGALRPFQASHEVPIIAWIGRLDYLKNWKEYFAILSQLQRADVPFEGWLIGRSTQPEIPQQVYRLAKRRNLLPRLRWFSNFPYDRVPILLDAVRSTGGVVVSTSRGESLGMSIIEAMARGCAVVVPNRSPFTEYIQDRHNGLTYPLGNASKAAEQIGSLLRNVSLRQSCGNAARQYALSQHAPEKALPFFVLKLREAIAM